MSVQNNQKVWVYPLITIFISALLVSAIFVAERFIEVDSKQYDSIFIISETFPEVIPYIRSVINEHGRITEYEYHNIQKMVHKLKIEKLKGNK